MRTRRNRVPRDLLGRFIRIDVMGSPPSGSIEYGTYLMTRESDWGAVRSSGRRIVRKEIKDDATP